MSSAVISAANFDFSRLKSYILKVDMEHDNRKNAALAILNKISRDLLGVFENFGGGLAHPERDLCTILMIIEEKSVKNEKLVEFFEKEHVSIKLEFDTDQFSIEKCLPFAIFYFMEKEKWFKIGDCFIQDGFLDWKSTSLPRIQMKTHCSSQGSIFLKFTAEIVRIHPFENSIFDRDERFSGKSAEKITKKVRPRWISCLPKLGKGQITEIHRKLPENSPFEDYDQMRSYWRKSYGYDLPPSEPEVYYTVKFRNDQSMLYPFFCVLTGNPEILQVRTANSMAKEALEMFLKNFKNSNIAIFGNQFLDPSQEESNSAAKAYLDVISMQPVNASRLKRPEKVTRKNLEPEKIYPKIPSGVKRAISSGAGTSVKLTRPKLGFSFE